MLKKTAEILLPLPLWNTYNYEIPTEMQDQMHLGIRVIVNFGSNKLYTGIVINIGEIDDSTYKLKPIYSIVDSEPIINDQQFEMWKWVSQYYCCSLGETLVSAMPNVLLPSSETLYCINESLNETVKLSEKEDAIVNVIIANKKANINKIISETGIKNPVTTLQRLVDKGLVSCGQNLKKEYKPIIANFVSYNAYSNEAIAFQPKNKQKEVIDFLNELCLDQQVSEIEIEERQLLLQTNSSKSTLVSLEKKGIVKLFKKNKSRINTQSENCDKIVALSEHQNNALNNIHQFFEANKPVLLYGITSSGKTEIYIKLIEETIAKGKQVLYLLPEIVLTSQIENRLRKYFGNNIGVYHSKYSDALRAETYKLALENKISIILGARSAVFMPFSNLGLIIVDEEHDTSYKQADKNPRYNARDMALVLAMKHKCNVILGSATPSVESYFNAKRGKYGLVTLTQRYGEVIPPDIEIVDMQDAYKRKIAKSHFHPRLIEEIKNSIANGEQVILFQNRRGYSNEIKCKQCGWVPKCNKCEVSLTYHKRIDRLVCHYCGDTYDIPHYCGKCGSTEILNYGIGTEQLEEKIKELIPEARVERLDYDTASSRTNYDRILNLFALGETDILIGTQIIAKGLDFPNVGLIGIINADNMLNFADFRAFERSFQMLSQVIGRAGRRHKQGKAIIQTFTPDHEIIKNVLQNNYEGMFDAQISEREFLKYPPFWNFATIRLRHKNIYAVQEAANTLTEYLQSGMYERVKGPIQPVVNRINLYYILNIQLKFEKSVDPRKIRKFIMDKIFMIKNTPTLSQVLIDIDIDPY